MTRVESDSDQLAVTATALLVVVTVGVECAFEAFDDQAERETSEENEQAFVSRVDAAAAIVDETQEGSENLQHVEMRDVEAQE